jgi:hypothetical protein
MAIVVTNCQAQHEPLDESVNIPANLTGCQISDKTSLSLLKRENSSRQEQWKMHRAEFVTFSYQYFYVTIAPHLRKIYL